MKSKKSLVGNKYGRLTVVSESEPVRYPSGQKVRMFNCNCSCGNSAVVSYTHLVKGDTKSCGCLKREEAVKKYTHELTGRTFGKLTVVKRVGTKKIGSNEQTSPLWECKCSCGNTTFVCSRDLTSGNTASCGCMSAESLRSNHLNAYDLSGDVGVGYSTNTGSAFLFDKEDYDKIKMFTWYESDTGYMMTNYHNQKIRMHRLIMNAVDGQEYDHKDRNPLNNQKSNLRLCGHSENMMNRRIQSNNTSGATGVYRSKNARWRAMINLAKKQHTLGEFESFEAAKSARETAEQVYYGEFAPTNN